MEVIVTETGTGRFTQEITIGKHKLTADEPVQSGGNDEGPSPYDFILAGLGTCTAMTLRTYAAFKHLPLVKVTVALTHDKIYAKDCENCENSNAKIDHIDRRITLEGDDLTEEQRKRLLDIANKCPVHRTLTSKIDITTTLT